MAAGPAVTVRALLRSRPESFGLPLTLLAGADRVDRAITYPRVEKVGLTLAGFFESATGGRILIFGSGEIGYLESLDPEASRLALAHAFNGEVPGVVLTGGLPPPETLVTAAAECGIPVLQTTATTAIAIAKLTSLLEDILAERIVVHGELLDILGLGVLIVGDSGIGKSECALDLIVRGHRLVADDTVEVRRRSETILIGTCPELTRHHMELRGLGLINVKELFGVASTRTSKRVELVVHLERWDTDRQYDRIGLDDEFHDILGLKVPLIRMPVAPGRNIAILVEVAARHQLLRARGQHPARLLVQRLEEQMRRDALVRSGSEAVGDIDGGDDGAPPAGSR